MPAISDITRCSIWKDKSDNNTFVYVESVGFYQKEGITFITYSFIGKKSSYGSQISSNVLPMDEFKEKFSSVRNHSVA